MTQEDRELLLRDLCARLPYGLYVQDEYGDIICINYNDVDFANYFDSILNRTIKPYLFPLSSMTEEEKEEYCQLQQRVIYNSKGVINEDVTKYINWCYKKHLDINNLIPMELAIDATGLNIYDKAKMNF